MSRNNVVSRFAIAALVAAAMVMMVGSSGPHDEAVAQSGWNIATVDTAGIVGKYASIDVITSARLGISYRDETNGDLKYATCDPPSSDSGKCDQSGEWKVLTLDSSGDVGDHTSMVVDFDEIVVAYRDVTSQNLKFAYCYLPDSANGICDDAGDWTTLTVDQSGSVGEYTSIDFSAGDSFDLHRVISYRDTTTLGLKYAVCTEGGFCDQVSEWDTVVVDSAGDVGQYTSIAADQNTDPMISYYDSSSGNLKFAVCDRSGSMNRKCDVTTDWKLAVVDSVGVVGSHTSITIDTNDDPLISYYDETGGNLRFAVCDKSGSTNGNCDQTADWETTLVDAGGNVGTFTSIAADELGGVFISYYDETNQNLNVASCDQPSSVHGNCDDPTDWGTEMVESTNDAGQYSSLGIDAKGQRVIAYFRETGDELRFAEDSEIESTDETIKIPVRWCGVNGAPSIDDPGVVDESTTNDVMWREHERASDNIYIPRANITFRSGATQNVGDFPLIDDPDTSIGEEGDVQATGSEFNTLINNCRDVWEMLDNTVMGITAVQINQFRDSSGDVASTIGRGGIPDFSSNSDQVSAGRIMVIDPAYYLSDSDISTRFDDDEGELVAHEFGHALSLQHVDPSSNLMHDTLDDGDGGTDLTDGQIKIVRMQALEHIDDREVDPVTPPLEDLRVDALGDVSSSEQYVDIDGLIVAVDQNANTTSMAISTLGLYPSNVADLHYLFLWDTDMNTGTGATPGDISAKIPGLTTTFQGAELVAQVDVTVTNGVPRAGGTVWRFQSGQLDEILDPSVRAQTKTMSVGLIGEPGSPPASDELETNELVSIEFSNSVRGPVSTNSQAMAVTENPNTSTSDDFETDITFALPAYPQCEVAPTSAPPGEQVTVTATGLFPNASAHVLLGPEEVATDQTNGTGSLSTPFTVPAGARSGPRLITAGTTAVTADCILTVSGGVGGIAELPDAVAAPAQGQRPDSPSLGVLVAGLGALVTLVGGFLLGHRIRRHRQRSGTKSG